MKKLLVIFAIILMALPSLTIIARSVDELEQQQAEIQEQIEEVQADIEVTQQEIDELMEQIYEKDRVIEFAALQLELTTQHLEITIISLEEAELALEQAKQDLEDHYERFQARLRAMYILGPLGYLEVVLQANSFTDVLVWLDRMNAMARHDHEMTVHLQMAEELVAYRIESLNDRIIEVENMQYIQAERLADLEEAQYQHHAFMYELEQDVYRYEVVLRQFQQADQQITEMIQRIRAEEERRRQEAQAAARRMGHEIVEPTGGTMRWPVPGHNRVTSRYGNRTRPWGRGTEFHTGIDIGAPRGTNIVAAESGTVVLSGWHGGFGQTVIIEHGNGLTTLYGHNSRNLVSVGDWVNRGDVIAHVGSTGFSTGPHLHFEVRRNGNHVNPNPFLGI